MNRCVSMAIDCTGQPTKGVYLDVRERFVHLCEPCIAVAQRMGMNPRDRRAVVRIPAWRRRSLAKIMDHGARVA